MPVCLSHTRSLLPHGELLLQRLKQLAILSCLADKVRLEEVLRVHVPRREPKSQ